MTVSCFVLVRENLEDTAGNPIPKDSPQRYLPVDAHWDREWLKQREQNGKQARWFVAPATVTLP
jgi:hypothetical protein